MLVETNIKIKSNQTIAEQTKKQLFWFCVMAGAGYCPYESTNGKCNFEDKCLNQIEK